jgi:uncharacterized membrane protein (DUF485 family)
LELLPTQFRAGDTFGVALREGRGRRSTGGEAPMAASVEKIVQNPKYQELVRSRSSLGWMLTIAMLVIYLGFIGLVAWDKALLAAPIGGAITTWGIPIGLFVIVSAFVLTGIYVVKANAKYDTLTRQIVEESK